MKKEDKRFYVTAPEAAGIFGTMGVMFTLVPWCDISRLDKAVAFCTICLIALGGVLSVELGAEMAADAWKRFKEWKAARTGR